MTTSLTDLLDPVKTEVNGPSAGSSTDVVIATDDGWLSALSNAFWTAKAEGLFTEWRELDFDLTYYPSGVADTAVEMDREHQQLIVLFAAAASVQAALLARPTRFKGSAAPGTEVEIEQSAQVFTELLKSINARLARLREQYSSFGSQYDTEVSVISTFQSRINAEYLY